MQNLDINNPIWSLIARFAINTVAIAFLIFFMYYRRYRDRELATTASMFNIFAFAVLTILSSVQFSLAAGFGLFAILALFSLRSEQIEKIEIAYFFGAIAIAVICSVQGTSLSLVISITLFVLLGAWILDHPKMLKSASSTKLTLDKIDPHVLSDTELMRAQLSERLGVEVMNFQITQLNYVNDLAHINVYYRN
jgi:ABC-type antimicrobial peptide transport system permease subunit